MITDAPECNIIQSEDEDEIKLTCEAKANPADVTFVWSRGGNVSKTIDASEYTIDGLISVHQLEVHESSFGTYYCQVNNSLGNEISGIFSLENET